MDNQKAEEFAVLWAAAQPTISAFVWSVVRDFHEAEEIVQRVAVALVRKFDRYDASRPFAAWAVGVAKYEVLYYRRQCASDRHLFDDELVERISQGYQRFAAETNHYREALEHCVQKLEGRSRRAVELRYATGLDFHGVGRELRMKPGAARMLLCRIRQSLRSCIERRVQALGDA